MTTRLHIKYINKWKFENNNYSTRKGEEVYQVTEYGLIPISVTNTLQYLIGMKKLESMVRGETE